MRACGLSGYRNDGDFSVGRHLRDVLSSPIMINNDRILANIATASLMSAVPTSCATDRPISREHGARHERSHREPAPLATIRCDHLPQRCSTRWAPTASTPGPRSTRTWSSGSPR